ncbi:hypothetical protein [Leucobacter sp. GX24907]
MTRRTKRRYAHELFPHAEEWETRPLDVEVPYRLARAVGFQVEGTSWFYGETQEDLRRTGERTMQMLNETRIALLAVALHKGMTGDAAWAWVDSHLHEEMEQLYRSCKEYGVDVDRIKPYPCGPEPDHHDHLSEPHTRYGFEARTVTRVQGRESECEECTEPAARLQEGGDNE